MATIKTYLSLTESFATTTPKIATKVRLPKSEKTETNALLLQVVEVTEGSLPLKIDEALQIQSDQQESSIIFKVTAPKVRNNISIKVTIRRADKINFATILFKIDCNIRTQGKNLKMKSYNNFTTLDVNPEWAETFKKAEVELDDADKTLSEVNGRIFPLTEDIFRAFDLPPGEIKVVIFGQDPYPHLNRGTPTACGLSFCVRRKPKGEKDNRKDLPPSLRNIYKEIKNCYDDFVIPTHGDISCWQSEGVMLLNTALTFSDKKNSHCALWAGFIDYVLATLAEKSKNCIYLLWGKHAEALQNSIKGTCYSTSHPSPFSVNRGFKGCNHFSKVNKKLLAMGENPIDWSVPL